MKNYLIILASGTGSRFGADCPKQFVRVRGKMILEYTLKACDCGLFDEMILVVSGEYVDEMKSLVVGEYETPVRVVAGGDSRRESCRNGVSAITDEEGFVVIHNGVQPFVTKEDFQNSLAALAHYPAVTTGAACVFTILETDGKGVLKRMPPRKNCFSDLGPECFRLSLLRQVLANKDSGLTNLTGTVLAHGLGDVYVVEGNVRNIKITYPRDIYLLEKMIDEQ